MKRFAPLTYVTGLFMAIALPLRTGAASDANQDVDSWINQQQASLTLALDEKLTDNAVGEIQAPVTGTAIDPMVITVSTAPMKRLPLEPAI